MRHFISIIPLLLFLQFPASAQDTFTDPRTGIPLKFDTGYGIFPKRWHSKKIRAEAIPVAEAEKERAVRIMLQAFSKYPEKVLKENLDEVYILERISFYGIPYGGTHYHNTLYLADNKDNPAYTEEFIRDVFYHEFSSILLRNHRHDLDKKTWGKINPEGFSYGKGGVEAIMNGTSSTNPDTSLMKEGFICNYSVSSFEEDFNIYSQYLFGGGKKFWDFVDQYDKVKAKTFLLIRFYQNIDQRFTEDYFRKLEL